MPLAVFSEIPLLGHDYGDDQRVAKLEYFGGGAQRSLGQAREYRDLVLPFKRNKTGRATIDTFFRARNYEHESFLYKDLNDYARAAIVLQPVTSGGSVTRWRIPTTGDNAGDYPTGEAATYVVRVGGSPVTVASVDTDLREFILSAGVSDASVVDADYQYYRRWSLLERFRWRSVAAGVGWYRTEIALRETSA